MSGAMASWMREATPQPAPSTLIPTHRWGSPCWVAELRSSLGHRKGWAPWWATSLRKQLEGGFRENTPIRRVRRKRSGHWASHGRMARWGAHSTGLCGGGLFLTSLFLLSAPPPHCATPRAPPASVLDHVFGPPGSLCGALCRAVLRPCWIPARCLLAFAPAAPFPGVLLLRTSRPARRRSAAAPRAFLGVSHPGFSVALLLKRTSLHSQLRWKVRRDRM